MKRTIILIMFFLIIILMYNIYTNDNREQFLATTVMAGPRVLSDKYILANTKKCDTYETDGTEIQDADDCEDALEELRDSYNEAHPTTPLKITTRMIGGKVDCYIQSNGDAGWIGASPGAPLGARKVCKRNGQGRGDGNEQPECPNGQTLRGKCELRTHAMRLYKGKLLVSISPDSPSKPLYPRTNENRFTAKECALRCAIRDDCDFWTLQTNNKKKN